MFCPMCGAPNEDEATYCANCGAALKDVVPPAEPVPAEEAVPVGEVVPPAEPAWPEESIPAAGLPVDDPANRMPLPPVPLSQPPLRSDSPPPPFSPRPAAVQGSAPVNGMAVASLVLGIAGLTVLPLISSIFAVIFGYMAWREIRQRPGVTSGDGAAVAGIVLGWIGIGLLVLALIGGGVALCGLCGVFGSSGY